MRVIKRLAGAAILGASVACVAAQSSAADGQSTFEAEQYEASGDWRLSHNSYSCTLVRDFARGRQRALLSLRRVHPGASIQYGVFGDVIERGRDPVIAGFIPSQSLTAHSELASAKLKQTPGFVFNELAYREAARASDGSGVSPDTVRTRARLIANTTHFVVQGLSERPIALQTGSMTEPLEKLDRCARDRLAEMGITEEVVAATASAPKPRDLKNWAEKISNIYPAEALRNGFDGTVEMRIIVDVEGKPRHCHVANQMIARTLREAACAAMLEHARFTPALNTRGEPLPGIAFQRVRYLIRSPANADGSRVRQ